MNYKNERTNENNKKPSIRGDNNEIRNAIVGGDTKNRIDEGITKFSLILI